jgi:G3E family GTPase
MPPPQRTNLAQGETMPGPDAPTLAHVVTGGFGAGKTTAIRRLMAQKPEQEFWVVILNEFTDAGLDALAVAESARGSYDVRLVAGGCLCCIGELEFGKQLRDILRNLRPARLLIEPSGAGHAADIVDELAAYQAQGALSLESVVCLVDPRDAARILATRSGSEWAQIQSADVLLMSKSDLADDGGREAFADIAAAQYPAKDFVGSCRDGVLPPEALERHSRPAVFSLVGGAPAAPPVGAVPPPSADAGESAFAVGGLVGTEARTSQLGLWAVSWVLPRELTFSRVVVEPRLTWMLDAYQAGIRRFKGVLRTGPGPSWLIQSHGRGLSAEDSGYRRDSRLELVLAAAPTEDFLDAWRGMLRDAALA